VSDKKVFKPLSCCALRHIAHKGDVTLALKAINPTVLPFSSMLLSLKIHKPFRLSKQHNAVFLSHILKPSRENLNWEAYRAHGTALYDLDYQIFRSSKDNSCKATSEIAEELSVSAKTVRRRLS
jgi:hypothetical protein